MKQGADVMPRLSFLSMGIFKEIENFNALAEWTFKIKKVSPSRFQVVIIVANPDNTDQAACHVHPMLLEGTSEELDNTEILFREFGQALSKTDSLFLNMASYLKSVETARENSEMEKASKNAQREIRAKWASISADIKNLMDKREFNQAYAMLPNAESFACCADEIKALAESIQTKLSQTQLF